ncbi:MAG: DUF349 domain-containing protein [Dermatophilaceae bacterium]|jgi:hypothetical protein|nr:DUF349 domain-containing protein [Dermatophilaceae bacterium]
MTESPLHESDAPDASDEPIALEAEVEAPVAVPEPDETVIEAAAEDIVAEAPAEEAEEPAAEDVVAKAPAAEAEEPAAEDVTAEVVDEVVAEEAPANEPVVEDVVEPVVEDVVEPVVEDVTVEVANEVAEAEEVVPSADAEATAAATPPPAPSPALFARSAGAPATSAFGRVGTDGVVFVKTADGEREVGSYPGVSNADALAYFGRKYDELAASLHLLQQRVTHTEMPAKEAADAVSKLRAQVVEARVVGDLAALDRQLDEIDAAIVVRREADTVARAAAKLAATTQREALVAEAEQISGQPEQKIQWKSSGARMRELLDEWKTHQRSGPRLDKDVEAGLWQRFSVARNSFDKARRTHFAALDSAHDEARTIKERLVAEAERLATSRDWMSTAGAFKHLMDDWRAAGRAGRAEDDALWLRFKSAQDTFFNAKDAIVAAEEEGFRANLAVKQALIVEAEAILPVTDLEKAKAALRIIQDKWDKAGKVPRADMERTEKAIRRVEQAVRDAEDRRWTASNPEAAARAKSLVEQLEKAVTSLEKDLASAQASGNAKKVADAQAALDARRQWLDQARSGLAEFGGR